jgi:hypothetical protein
MRIVFYRSDYDTFASGTIISFGSLDYVTDQLGDLYLQDPESTMQEEELHSLYIFLTGLEDSMVDGAPTLARHMDLYTLGLFIKHGREHILGRAIEFLLRSPLWRSNATQEGLPHDTLIGFFIGLRNVRQRTSTC